MIANYINYFRNLAVLHPDILHQVSAEGLDGDVTGVKFGMFWEADLFNKVPPAGINSPDITMHLHLLEGRTDDSTGYFSINGKYDGGLVLTKRAILGDYEGERIAYKDTFEVLMDILVELKDQSRARCDGFAPFDFQDIQFFQVGPIWDNRFGWWLKFSFDKPLGLEDRTNIFTI